MLATTLSEYLADYGNELVSQLERAAEPLSRSGLGRVNVELLREPMSAQWDRINAALACWEAGRQSAILSAAPGTGKTIMSMVAVHSKANGSPYRALVVCPPHLTTKWRREIQMTLPGAVVKIVNHYSDILAMKGKSPEGPEWFVISNNRAKLGAEWKPAYSKDHRGLLRCPNCNGIVWKNKVDKRAADLVPANHADLEKRQHRCSHCDEALFQWKGGLDRWPVAHLINRKLRHEFEFLILDEAHEMRSENTAAGHISAQLSSSIRYKLWLTGTLLNGYALSVFPMCFRAMPQNVLDEGFQWGQSLDFARRYGRIETTTTYKDDGSSNRQSQGQSKTTAVRVRPGIVPSLYGDCLIENTIFCQLSDLGFQLPPLAEILEPVPMDAEMASAYERLENDVRSNVNSMIAKGNKGALSAMLNTLLGWVDHPYQFGRIGYQSDEGFVVVADPPDLDAETIRAKEARLIEIVKDNKARGRQCWVYVQMTDKHDIQERLKKLLQAEGLTCEILRSKSVPTDKREAWIYKHGKSDVIISHPALVQTGLDLFDVGGNHNFATLIFYETGYQLDTLRQAACRAHRIGQTLDCEVWYLYYAQTMQASAVNLMARKTAAAQAVEGKFSAEGLASLTAGSESPAIQLARMLVDKTKAPSPVKSIAKAKAEAVPAAKPVKVKGRLSDRQMLDILLQYPAMIEKELEGESAGTVAKGRAKWRFTRMLSYVRDLPHEYQAEFSEKVNVGALRKLFELTPAMA
jgi:hypothetical protein